jgi:hypothetical protein
MTHRGLKHVAVLNKDSTTALHSWYRGDGISLVQVRDKWWAVMNVVMDIGRFLEMQGVS